MKVLHVIPSIPKVRGGPSRAAVEMVQALRQKGIDAEIATTNDDGDNLLYVPLQRRVIYDHVPVWFFHRFSPKTKAIREYAFSTQLTTWLWHNMTNYDLIHVHALFSYPSTVAMTIARSRQIPYIVQPHGLLCEWSLQQSRAKKQTYLKLVERTNLEHSQALHLTAQQELTEVAKLDLSVSTFNIPLGLSPAPMIADARQKLRQKLNLADDQPIILFLSRLHPKKGLDYLIAALSKIRHHRFTFVIAGNGTPEYEAEIASMLSHANLSDRTHLTGFIEGETKDLFLQGSDLFALTSHSENFGVVVLEAWAAGLPVLLTPGVALATVAQQNQIGYVPELNIEAIAEALDTFLTYPHLGREMGIRGRQTTLEQYSWESIAKQLSDIYLSVT
jgi:glycosyltransferase involved in cell wall biosynthesis